jgi:hypothetical protein
MRETPHAVGPSNWNRMLALFPLIHKLLVLAVIVGVTVAFYQPLVDTLRYGEAKVGAFGVELQLSSQGALQGIFKEKKDSRNFDRVYLPLNARLLRIRDSVIGRKILWIDENHPTQNIQERDVLREMGLFVEIVDNLDQAKSLLEETRKKNLEPHRVIISDLGKTKEGSKSRSGQEDLGVLFRNNDAGEAKMILYTGSYDPFALRPNFVFGLTNRYDELFHLIFDALERNSTVLPRPATSTGTQDSRFAPRVPRESSPPPGADFAPDIPPEPNSN